MNNGIDHFDHDFANTLIEMMCYHVSRSLTICPYFNFANIKEMVVKQQKSIAENL
jgi:hypothetical protein